MRLQRLAISEEGFIFDPETGNSYTVNETGLFVLKGLLASRPRQEIAQEMAAIYDVSPAEGERDIDEFLEILQRHGLWKGKEDD